MKRVLGIDRKIRRPWLDTALDRLAQNRDNKQLRAFVEEILRQELAGKESRDKTTSIISRIWSAVPAPSLDLRNRAVEMLPRISGQERIWLHWGMTALAYPFFRDIAEVIGRLLSLQDDFTTTQVQGRMITNWGDRETSRTAVPKIVNTLLDWDVLSATKKRGHFLLARKLTTGSQELQLWLLEALLAANAADEIEAQQFQRLPELFPFTLSIGLAEIRQHEGFSIHRQGLHMDMVTLRPVKKPILPEPAPKKPASKKARHAVNPAIEKTPVTLASPEPPIVEQIIVEVAEVEILPVAAAEVRPDQKPTRRLRKTQETKPAKPEAKRENTEAELVKPEAELLKPALDQPTAPVNVLRPVRLAIVGEPALPPGAPFSGPIGECVSLFHEGHDFACIALVQDLIDALLRHLCKTKLGAKQAKCADIRTQLGGLAAISALSLPLKTRLEKLWYERVDYLTLDTNGSTDKVKLDQIATSHVTALVELAQLVAGLPIGYRGPIRQSPEQPKAGKKVLPKAESSRNK